MGTKIRQKYDLATRFHAFSRGNQKDFTLVDGEAEGTIDLRLGYAEGSLEVEALGINTQKVHVRQNSAIQVVLV